MDDASVGFHEKNHQLYTDAKSVSERPLLSPCILTRSQLVTATASSKHSRPRYLLHSFRRADLIIVTRRLKIITSVIQQRGITRVVSRSDLKNARARGQMCTPSVGRFKVTRVIVSREFSSAVERFERSTTKERTRDETKGDSLRGAILIGKRRITTDFEVRRSVRKPSDIHNQRRARLSLSDRCSASRGTPRKHIRTRLKVLCQVLYRM